MIDHRKYKFSPVPWARPGCGLVWSERLVWGCLVFYRDRDRPLSARQLEPLVGLSRGGVTTALQGTRGGRVGLLGHGLAKPDGDGWRALEPAGPLADWFVPRKSADGAPWWHRIAYWPCCLPTGDCELTSPAVGLVWLAAALQLRNRPTTAAGVAQWLGVTPKTVTAAIEQVAGLGILSWFRGGGGKTRSEVVFSDPLPAIWDRLWVPRHQPEDQAPVEKKVKQPERVQARVEPPPPKAVQAPPPVQPPVVQRAPEVQVAAPPKDDREGRTTAAAEAWAWNRGLFLEALDEVGIKEAHQARRQIVATATRIGEAVGRWCVGAGDVMDADAEHDRKHGPDCSRMLIYRLRKRLQEAEEVKAREDAERARRAAVLAPLRAFEMVEDRHAGCVACGARVSLEIGFEPAEDRWPADVRELVAGVRQVPYLGMLRVGLRGSRCGCGAVQPGLVVLASRQEIVGGRPVTVVARRWFPDAVPLTVPVAVEAAPPDDFLKLLGDPPADAPLKLVGPADEFTRGEVCDGVERAG